MKRALYQDLLVWKDAPRRKPLILDGARQTGKTWLLREFGGQEFRTTHYLNFETDPRICTIFAGDLRPETILPLIELHTGVSIDRARDVIVLDEIQTCPRALTALKYFLEQLPEMAVCAAGSLIGLAGSDESWPVGKVTTLRLHPLSFSEFLEATDELLFSHFLRFADAPSPLPEAVHQKLTDTLWLYLSVGGMPEAVARYVDSGVLDAATVADVGRIHADLVTGYRSDFARHAGTVNAHHLSRVFDAVPAQLSRSVDGGSSRFTFKDVLPNSRRFRDLAGPIDWLTATGLVIQSMVVDDPGVPLAAHRRESMFKLYLLDVGLLHHILGVPAASIVSQTWGSYKGYVAENSAAVQLRSAGVRELYTWTGKASEIEFLIPTAGGAVPIEIKSGRRARRARSLSVYREKYGPPIAVKAGAANYHRDEDVIYLPLYAIGQLPRILGRTGLEM
jgi:predicted AAA+ superfamily ATPase